MKLTWPMRLVFACIGLIYSSPLPAAMVTFTNRSVFQTAAGTTTLEDFNSFVSEVAFHTVPLDVGDFSISMTGSPSTAADRNKIDIPPHNFAVLNVDGTPLMNVLTFLPQSLFLTFDTPINAFGADFSDFNNQLRRTNIIVNGTTILPPIYPGGVVQFFGLVSDSPFNSVEFRAIDSVFGDGYGIDNVEYSTTAAPEPTSVALMAASLIVTMVGGRFKSRRVSRNDSPGAA